MSFNEVPYYEIILLTYSQYQIFKLYLTLPMLTIQIRSVKNFKIELYNYNTSLYCMIIIVEEHK